MDADACAKKEDNGDGKNEEAGGEDDNSGEKKVPRKMKLRRDGTPGSVESTGSVGDSIASTTVSSFLGEQEMVGHRASKASMR